MQHVPDQGGVVRARIVAELGHHLGDQPHMPSCRPRPDAAMVLEPRGEPVQENGPCRFDGGRLNGLDPPGRGEVSQEAAQFGCVRVGEPRLPATEHPRDPGGELPFPEARNDIRREVAKADARQVQPDDQSGACVPVRVDRPSRVAAVAHAAEEGVQQLQIVLQLAGGLDMPRLFEESHEPHEFGGSAALAPALDANRRAERAATAIVSQKAVDDGGVHLLQFDAGEVDPDQEVAGDAPVAAEEILAEVRRLTTEIVNEGCDQSVFQGPVLRCGRHECPPLFR